MTAQSPTMAQPLCLRRRTLRVLCVRARLARQLCHANLSHGGYLPLIALSPHWEQAFAASIVGSGPFRIVYGCGSPL